MKPGLASLPREYRFSTIALAILAAFLSVSEANAGTWTGEAGVRVIETLTDNVGRQPASAKRSDLSTEVSPYVSYGGRGARAQGSIDARLQNFLHTDSQTSNRSGLQLNAVGSLEAYEDRFFIDTALSNDRQQISAFGAPDSSYGGTGNSTEVTRFSLSPYLRWRFGSSTNATLRYRYEKVNSDFRFASGQTGAASLDLQNGSAFGRLGWAFNASHYDVENEAVEASSTDSYTGTLTYVLTPALLASLSGGQEFSDFAGGRRQHSWNWGGGLKWNPDERTSFSGQTSKRVFGRGFNYQFSHRFVNSAVEWSYVRDLNVVSNTTSLGNYSVPNFSRYYEEYKAEMDALASTVPDLVERDRIAKEHLAAKGVSIYDLMQLDYLSGQSSINKRMRLAWVIYGVRNSVTFAGFKSERQSVSQDGIAVAGAADDLSTHQSVKERGWDATWTHDLSALTTLGVRYAYSDVSGQTRTGQLTSTHSNSIGLNLNTKLAPYTTGGMSFNHIRSTGSAEYRENSVSVQLNHRF